MKTRYLNLLLIVFIVSCSKVKEIEIANYFNSEEPFTMVWMDGIDALHSKKIYPEEKKYEEIVKWLNSNNQGWELPTVSTRNNGYYNSRRISQDEFKLSSIGEMKYVYLSFVDENGKAHEYVKAVNPKNLENFFRKIKNTNAQQSIPGK